MLVYDLLMIAVLIAATAWGVYKGLAWQIASLASIFVSYVVAANFCGVVAPLIRAQPPWNLYAAMLMLYLGSSLAVWIAFRLVKTTIDGVKLQEFDKHVGGVFGAAKGVVLCVIITLFGVTLLGERERQSIVRSYSGYYIAVLLDKSHPVIPTAVHQAIHPLLHKLDESLLPRYQPVHGPEQPYYAPPAQNAYPPGSYPPASHPPNSYPPPNYPPAGNQPYRFGEGASSGNGLFDLR